MARSKPATPMRRETSSEYISKHDRSRPVTNNNGKVAPVAAESGMSRKEAGLTQLVVAIAGIYGSFLTWAFLQEKVLTTPYGAPGATEVFKFPVFLSTAQSIMAVLTGTLYLYASTPRGQAVPRIIPSRQMTGPLLFVSLTSALSSPFGYAALAHVNYITFTLAKSCKLLPVMFLHITLFQRRYPLYKYLVVAAVTAGVAVFTLHSGKKHATTAKTTHSGHTAWGMLLLSINLLFDGLLNSTQDYIFAAFRPYSGPQMMCANNLMSALVTGSYLLLSPWLVHTGLGEWLGMDTASGGAGELSAALAFLARHPAAWRDVLGFAACGAVGQVFIFYTLAQFGSVLLITLTVTRKMLTMTLSVLAFGHRLTNMQWLGVLLVFGGIGVEAEIKRRQEQAKANQKRSEPVVAVANGMAVEKGGPKKE